MLKVFGALLDDNAKFIETTFDVQYVFGNQLESAIFQIISHIGERVEFNFRFGFDELPNFDKKLADLPLEETTISDIFTHAKTIIPQTWPDVNYNYPQVFTDKYKGSNTTWETFLGVINNYDGTNFLVNTFQTENFTNKNIIQPSVYLLHILKQGFADAGFTLKGDILSNLCIKKLLIFADIDYFDLKGNINPFQVTRNDWDVNNMGDLGYEEIFQLEANSLYRIKGKIFCYSKATPNSNNDFSNSWAKLTYNSSPFFSISNSESQTTETFFQGSLSTTSDTNPLNQKLNFTAISTDANFNPADYMLDITIEKVLDNSPSEVHIKNEVNLKNVVPDVTFGKLLTVVKNWFNLEITPKGKDIYINFIKDNINYTNSEDLSNFEVLKPKKEFNKLDSFLLKYADANNKEITFQPIFISKDIIDFSNNLVDKQTETIEIDILPLPQKSENLIQTAFSSDLGGASKIYAILYDGLQNNVNTTLETTPLMIPTMYEVYHKIWLDFRLRAISYSWVFKMYLEQLSAIDKKVFAYGRYHIVKTLDKTQISEDLFEVEIETKTLP